MSNLSVDSITFKKGIIRMMMVIVMIMITVALVELTCMRSRPAAANTVHYYDEYDDGHGGGGSGGGGGDGGGLGVVSGLVVWGR